jgi:methionine-rich copper-binding protein CopC
MINRRGLLYSGVALALICGRTRLASAHSFPQVETPAAGQTLTLPPSRVSIKFDAPIEQLFAQLQIINSDGKDEAAGAPEVSTDGYTLSIKVAALKAGAYAVKWAGVCIDTHHTTGAYDFTISGNGS